MVSSLDFRPGDVAACYGGNLLARSIQLATCWPLAPKGLRWPPSHVALLCPNNHGLVWWESTTLSALPCLHRQQPVSGVQIHDPLERILEYVDTGGRVDIYRLNGVWALSHREEIELRAHLSFFLRQQTRYDALGAAISAERVFQLLRWLPGADLDELFCSEFLAACLMRVGRLNLDNPTRFNPGRLLRTLVRQGVYRWRSTFASPEDLEEAGLPLCEVLPLGRAA